MKRFMVCWDGTRQEPTVEDFLPTNIVKIARRIKPIARDSVPQILDDDAGLDTGDFKGRNDLAVARI